MQKSNQPTIHQAMQRAAQLHQAGHLEKAEKIYGWVLEQQPENPDALHLLALIALHRGDAKLAVEVIEEAVRLRPRVAEFHVNLAQAYRQLGKLPEALAAATRSVQLGPDIPEAHNNRGNLLLLTGRFAEAIEAFKTALRLRPGYAQAHSNLGNAYERLYALERAVDCYQQALQINPNDPEALCNLGNALRQLGQLDEAAAACRKAIGLKGDLPQAHNNLANVLQERGQLAEAVASYRRAIAAQPNDAVAHSNLLFLLNHLHPYDPAAVFAEHRAWGERHGAGAEPAPAVVSPFAAASPFAGAASPFAGGATPKPKPQESPSRNPGDPLRIGYVSADFHQHSVTYFFEPILTNHDPAKVHVTCYSDVRVPDPVTQRLQTKAQAWRPITGKSDDEVAKLIREDRIDILVDLSGHTARNRLLTFARKPAPLQVTYLGYPNTTGLKAIDFRLTDALADPAGKSEAHHTEKLLRLPGCFLCYSPPETQVAVGQLPAAQTPQLTFGSFNHFSKVSAQVMAVWARILKRLPQSRLLLKARSLGNAGTRTLLVENFARLGIPADRLLMQGWEPTTEGHLRTYNQVDIALDTFPYNGTTTTCEALWMGVPVVSLAGAGHAGRVGLSLMTAVGLPELVAQDEDGYVDLASRLAADPRRLADLRAGLRQKLLTSPLTDAPRFTRDLEKAYATMAGE